MKRLCVALAVAGALFAVTPASSQEITCEDVTTMMRGVVGPEAKPVRIGDLQPAVAKEMLLNYLSGEIFLRCPRDVRSEIVAELKLDDITATLITGDAN